MLKRAFISGIYIFILSVFSALNAQDGYIINVQIDGLSNTDVILGHYFASQSLYPDDTAHLDQSGNGVFTGDKPLNQGLYFVYLPNGTYFDILMGEDQTFSVKTDTINLAKNLKVEGSKDNSVFLEFQQYMISKQGEMKKLQDELKDTTLSKKQTEKIHEGITKLLEEKKDKVHIIVEKNPGMLVSVFLMATIDVEVPEEIKEDQQAVYEFTKAHYFDNFDLSDTRLLHTPLYENKMTKFLDKMVLQIPDSLIKEIDVIIEKSKADSAIFRYVLITLFNKYAKSQIMGLDAVQVHIADNYYIDKAWWSDNKFIDELKERVEILKPLLIGKTAPDVELRAIPEEHFKVAANDTALKRYPHAGNFINISKIPNEFIVLLFWEAECSHCKKVVPKMYNIYENELKDQGIEVLAISTLFGEDGKEKWIDFVNKYGLYNWVNAWNPYDYQYKITYDIRSTPQIYVLNKDKEIIGKKLGPENVLELINAYKKLKEKE